jgi:hypothetical protein
MYIHIYVYVYIYIHVLIRCDGGATKGGVFGYIESGMYNIYIYIYMYICICIFTYISSWMLCFPIICFMGSKRGGNFMKISLFWNFFAMTFITLSICIWIKFAIYLKCKNLWIMIWIYIYSYIYIILHENIYIYNMYIYTYVCIYKLL